MGVQDLISQFEKMSPHPKARINSWVAPRRISDPGPAPIPVSGITHELHSKVPLVPSITPILQFPEETPTNRMETQTNRMKTQTNRMETPTNKMETQTNRIETPTNRMEPQTQPHIQSPTQKTGPSQIKMHAKHEVHSKLGEVSKSMQNLVLTPITERIQQYEQRQKRRHPQPQALICTHKDSRHTPPMLSREIQAQISDTLEAEQNLNTTQRNYHQIEVENNETIPRPVCRAIDFVLHHHLEAPKGLDDLFKYEISDVEVAALYQDFEEDILPVSSRRNVHISCDIFWKFLKNSKPPIVPIYATDYHQMSDWKKFVKLLPNDSLYRFRHVVLILGQIVQHYPNRKIECKKLATRLAPALTGGNLSSKAHRAVEELLLNASEILAPPNTTTISKSH